MNKPVECLICELPHAYPRVRMSEYSLYGVVLEIPMQSYECQYCGSDTLLHGTDKINVLLAKTYNEYLNILHKEGIIG